MFGLLLMLVVQQPKDIKLKVVNGEKLRREKNQENKPG
jgi:hypothetical protein